MKVNIQKLARAIFPIVTCCVVLACCFVPASAYEVWNVFDHIDNITMNGDIANVTFILPEDNIKWAFNDNGKFTYLSGQNVHFTATAGQAFNVYFNPFGPIHSQTPNVGAYFRNNVISTADLPTDATFNHTVKIGISNGTPISYRQIRTSVFYSSSDNQYLSLQTFMNDVEWDSEVFNLWIRSTEVPIDVSAGSGFHTQTFISGLSLPYSGSTNFAYEFSISFNVSKAYLDYVNSGRYSAALEAIEDQLVANGQTLSGIMEQQKQTNQSLESILNGTKDQQNSADKFQDDMDDSIKDIEDAGDSMQAVTTPSIDFEQVLPDDVLEGQEFLAYTAAIKKFWESPVLTSMFVILGGLMFVSFVIFGKKG